ncbi:MAG: ArsC family transcriptional regulator [Clostridia bacterium]|nr:ArsC family transcriptional regulator [Clostridia bacterium]
MTVQIYISKKNFDVQKAQRFFKERRIPVQEMDLKKHPLGQREVSLFAARLGASALIDREDRKVKEHPACYYNKESDILDAIVESPWLLRSPIVRCGQKVTAGYTPQAWEEWMREN